MSSNFSQAYTDIIIEENLFSSISKVVSQMKEKLSDKNLPINTSEALKCLNIAKKLDASQANSFLLDFSNFTKIINEDTTNDSNLESSGKKAISFFNFLKKYDYIFSILIPFYDGLITDEELKVLPDAFKSIFKGTWGRSLLNNSSNLIETGSKISTKTKKSFRKITKLSKHGFKRGGKAALRLSKRQLAKLSSKVIFKPLSSILTKLSIKLGIAAAGAGATGATAATGIGIPISVLIGIATVIYTIWLILDILSIVNDILRLVAQVHIDDQKISLEENEEDNPEVEKMINDNYESFLDQVPA